MGEQDKSAYEQLENKQKAFVDAYFLLGFNATQAAIKAGYSRKTARQIGAENLSKLGIKAAISERMAEQAMSADEVLARLGAIARSDIAEVKDLEFAEANGTSFLIKSYSVSERGERIEMYSALEALKLIGTHHKLFVERQEVTGKDGGPIEVDDVGLSDDERAKRINALLDRARTRRT